MVSFLAGVATGGGMIVKAVKDDADLVANIEATGATVVAIHDSAEKVVAVGGVAAYHGDKRQSTDDGAYFAPGVTGEGLLGGNLTALNGVAGFTIQLEFAISSGISAQQTLFSRKTGDGATQQQVRVFFDAARVYCRMGNGATVSESYTAGGTIVAGVRYRLFVRYDGTAGTDATKLTFWLSSYDPLTDSWSALAESAPTVGVAGFPATTITLGSCNFAIARNTDSTAVVFNGLIGGNGNSIRTWTSALTEAQMNAEIASPSAPVIAALLAYDFSGATPLTNLGTAGATGDLTAGANTVKVSGDRQYFGLASAGTNRPTYNTAGVYAAKVYDGSNDYDRSVARGQLASITADMAYIHIGTTPTAGGSTVIAAITSGTSLGLQFGHFSPVLYATSNSATSLLADSRTPIAGVNVWMASRTSNIAGNLNRLTPNLVAENAGGAATPTVSTAITRVTYGSTGSDAPGFFAAFSANVQIIVRGITSADVRQQIEEICAAYAARFCGATVT